MPRGRTVRIFLIDGMASGRIKCTITNWTGVVYKIPRAQLNRCRDLQLLRENGIFLLFDSDNVQDQKVYVGYTGVHLNEDGLLGELQRVSADFNWNEAVAVTITSGSFSNVELSYLESSISQMIRQAGRYEIEQQNPPGNVILDEETECDLDEFTDEVKTVMSVLGYKVFEPAAGADQERRQRTATPSEDDESPILYMTGRGANASGKLLNNGRFIVYRGSRINPATTNSCPENALRMREEYAGRISSTYELLSDIMFSSPSAAAGFVGGCSLSGNAMWHDAENHTLGDILAGRI